MKFNRETITDMRVHAESEFPKESCGLVVGGVYKPCRNTATFPIDQFDIHPEDLLKATKYKTLPINAIIHSHTLKQGDNIARSYPSFHDQEEQIKTGDIWGIVVCHNGAAKDPYFWGDSLPIPPLEGREFIFGAYDCWALIRDYYRLSYSITLENIPRKWNWWETDNLDYYGLEAVKRNNMFEVPLSDIKPGDIFMVSLRAKVINHCGIYLGNGLILHHLQNHLSRKDPIGPWLKHIRRFVRHKENK